MKFSELYKVSKQAAEQSDSYRNYLCIRESVMQMMEEMQSDSNYRPSDYWKEELSGMDYMLDASPLIIDKLREHCYHLTGIRSYDYRGHHVHQKSVFEQKWRMLQQQDVHKMLVAEADQLGGFGYTIDGALYNLDTLKYYECLIALSKAGILTGLREPSDKKKIVLEIGAGWGGFAYQFKTLFPDTTYVIFDLPQVILFSAVYLRTLFPSASVFVYGDESGGTMPNNARAYDFVFLPHYLINDLQLEDVYLTINLVSFQEMTSAQVDTYVRKAAKIACPYLYSLNRDRSRHNTQLTTVSTIINNYYDSVETKVLDMAYVDLPKAVPANACAAAGFGRLVKKLSKRRTRKGADYRYRHLVGTLRK